MLASLQSSSPTEDNINVDFWKWDLGGWCPISDWHIQAHYTPNLCLQHCRAEVITSHHQTLQKRSTGTQPEHSILISQLRSAAHVTDQQTSFWKAECERRCNKDLLIQVPLSVANQDTSTSYWPFFSYYPYKSILLLLIPRPEVSKPAFLTTSICLTGQIWLKWLEILWKDEKFHQYCITGYTSNSIDLAKQYQKIDDFMKLNQAVHHGNRGLNSVTWKLPVPIAIICSTHVVCSPCPTCLSSVNSWVFGGTDKLS